MSTTEWMGLTKIDDRSVGWTDQVHADLDTKDLAGRGNLFLAVASEAINQYQLLTWAADLAADPREVRLADLENGTPVMGIAMSSVAAGNPVLVMTKGPIVNSGWAWTEGEIVYANAGGSALQGYDGGTDMTNIVGDGAGAIGLQRVGHAIGTDAIWFEPWDPRGRDIVVVQSLPAIDASGSLTRSFKNVTGTTWAEVLTYSGAGGPHTVVYPFVLPRNVWRFGAASASTLVALGLNYIAVSGGTVDFLAFNDGAGNRDTLTFTPVGATSWGAAEVSHGVINGDLTVKELGKETVVYVEVEVTGGAAIDIETTMKLRALPDLTTI